MPGGGTAVYESRNRNNKAETGESMHASLFGMMQLSSTKVPNQLAL